MSSADAAPAKNTPPSLPTVPKAEMTPKHARFSLQRWEGSVPAQAKVLWKLYGWKSIILLFWVGSRDQARKALKFLYCRHCAMGLLKAQNRNCTIAAVGSSIAALIGITSMAVFTDKGVHWLCRAAWNSSVFSAFLSAFFACRHTAFINNVLLEDSTHVWEVKRWFQQGSEEDDAHPPLATVLLLSGTEMFFDTSVIAYNVGLGIYLGCVWHKDLDPDFSQTDSRNIFIFYLVSGFTCICIYFSLRFAPHARESEEWDRFFCHLNDEDPGKRRPFIWT